MKALAGADVESDMKVMKPMLDSAKDLIFFFYIFRNI